MYIASLGQEVCVIMDVFPHIACSEELYSLPWFSSTARTFVQQKSVDRWGTFWNVRIQPPNILFLWNSNDNVKNDGLWRKCLPWRVGYFILVWFGFFHPKFQQETLWNICKHCWKDWCVYVCVHFVSCSVFPNAIMNQNKLLEMICVVACWFMPTHSARSMTKSCHHLMAI